jgi:hypothetical protein
MQQKLLMFTGMEEGYSSINLITNCCAYSKLDHISQGNQRFSLAMITREWLDELVTDSDEGEWE